jgi:hypothetical protein
VGANRSHAQRLVEGRQVSCRDSARRRFLNGLPHLCSGCCTVSAANRAQDVRGGELAAFTLVGGEEEGGSTEQRQTHRGNGQWLRWERG